MPLGAPCDCIMAILDHLDAMLPFLVTSHPTLMIFFANQCHYATNVSGFSKASMN